MGRFPLFLGPVLRGYTVCSYVQVIASHLDVRNFEV